jgi:hypothetical protein
MSSISKTEKPSPSRAVAVSARADESALATNAIPRIGSS